ncbi:MAG: hypothetical protein IKA70_04665 [Alistipes sp.]|nr:hypothetical protein [Alistipes sp.]
MNRAHLHSAVEQLSSSFGYDFVSAADQSLPSLVRQLPTVLMAPPEFRSMEGRNSGRITYRVTLHLLHGAAKASPKERAEMLDTMERDALDIFSALCEERFVASVEQLTMAPAAKPVTNYGDVALRVSAEVITIF